MYKDHKNNHIELMSPKLGKSRAPNKTIIGTKDYFQLHTITNEKTIISKYVNFKRVNYHRIVQNVMK